MCSHCKWKTINTHQTWWRTTISENSSWNENPEKNRYAVLWDFNLIHQKTLRFLLWACQHKQTSQPICFLSIFCLNFGIRVSYHGFEHYRTSHLHRPNLESIRKPFTKWLPLSRNNYLGWTQELKITLHLTLLFTALPPCSQKGMQTAVQLSNISHYVCHLVAAEKDNHPSTSSLSQVF